MVNKKYLVLILILSLISISAISAADDSTETSINKIKDDKIVLDNNNNEEISRSIENNELNLDKHNNGNNLDSKVNNPTITDSNTLNFSQLNEAINGNTNDTIYLTNRTSSRTTRRSSAQWTARSKTARLCTLWDCSLRAAFTAT